MIPRGKAERSFVNALEGPMFEAWVYEYVSHDGFVSAPEPTGSCCGGFGKELFKVRYVDNLNELVEL